MTTCQNIDVYPNVFLRTLTLSWHFQAPFNLYAFYCIVFLSPKAMNTFRWHLFVYQFSSTFLDFTFSMGLTPVVVPAITFGYSVGLYRNFMGCHEMFTLSLVCMTVSASSIVEIFFCRWQNILLPNSSLKLRSITYYSIWITAMTTLFSSIALLHYVMETDQEAIRAQWRQIYSCTDFLFSQPGAWACETRKYYWVVLYGVVSCLVGGSCMLSFLYQSLQAINQMAANRSVNARNVQKRLILLLCAQLMFPLTAYAAGGTTIVISLALQLARMQQAFNVAILIFSNYGLAASLCLIFCNEPYWRHTKRILCCEFFSEKVVLKTVYFIKNVQFRTRIKSRITGIRARKKELTVIRVSDRSAINS